MRIDFRRSFVLAALALAAALLVIDVTAPAAHAVTFGRRPGHGRSIDRPTLVAHRREARLRASRSGLRSRLVPVSGPRGAPVPVQAAAGGPGDDLFAKLRWCEAGGRYNTNSGNGYYGAYQMTAGIWRSLGYPGLPHEAAPTTQDEAARRLQARSGWGQWPACSRRIGAR
jgi:Transglycosylase-like domain